LLDLAILWTDLRVRQARGNEVTAARKEALEVLAQAEALWSRAAELLSDTLDVTLTVDDPKSPHRYQMDGAWKDLRIEPLKFRVKLWGPFSRPVTRTGYWSEHGPVFVTERGVFAVSFSPDGKHVATGGFEGKVRIFDAETAALVKEFIPVTVTPTVAAK